MSDATYALPMFPLGTVLVPHAITTLHIFELRYRALAKHCTDGDGEFGVVLIERGHEVGGGDTRFGVGTVARIVEAVELPDGRWVLAARGTRRIRIAEWLADDPYPKAMVEDLSGTTLSDGDTDLVATTEQLVRRSLAYKAELDEPAVAATVELHDELTARAFQLLAIAPLGPLDKQSLLEEDDAQARVERLRTLIEDENDVLSRRLSGN